MNLSEPHTSRCPLSSVPWQTASRDQRNTKTEKLPQCAAYSGTKTGPGVLLCSLVHFPFRCSWVITGGASACNCSGRSKLPGGIFHCVGIERVAMRTAEPGEGSVQREAVNDVLHCGKSEACSWRHVRSDTLNHCGWTQEEREGGWRNYKAHWLHFCVYGPVGPMTAFLCVCVFASGTQLFVFPTECVCVCVA